MRFFSVIPLLVATVSGVFAAPIPSGESLPSLVAIQRRDGYLYRGTNKDDVKDLAPTKTRLAGNPAIGREPELTKADHGDHYVHGGSGISVSTDPSALSQPYLWRKKEEDVQERFKVTHTPEHGHDPATGYHDTNHHSLHVHEGQQLTHAEIKEHFRGWERVPDHERLQHAQKEGAHPKAVSNYEKAKNDEARKQAEKEAKAAKSGQQSQHHAQGSHQQQQQHHSTSGSHTGETHPHPHPAAAHSSGSPPGSPTAASHPAPHPASHPAPHPHNAHGGH